MNQKELEEAWNRVWELIAMMPIDKFYLGRIQKEFGKLQMACLNQPDNQIRKFIRDIEILEGEEDQWFAFEALKKKWEDKLIVTTPKQRREAEK